MRFTETVLMSCAEKNWNSTPLMAEATGSDGFMFWIRRALHPRPVFFFRISSAMRSAGMGSSQAAGTIFRRPKSSAAVQPTRQA